MAFVVIVGTVNKVLMLDVCIVGYYLIINVNKCLATDHVNSLLSSCSSLLFALRVLRSRGIPTVSLQDVFRSTVLAKITYCTPAWSGTCTAADRAKLDAFLSRCKRLGYCDKSVVAISNIFSNADDSLFESINTNSCHILYQYLPDRRYSESVYNLRPRNHNRSLITKTTYLNQQDFLIRMLYKNSY